LFGQRSLPDRRTAGAGKRHEHPPPSHDRRPPRPAPLPPDALPSRRPLPLTTISKHHHGMTTAPDHHFPSLHRVHRTGWLNYPNEIMETVGRWHVNLQHNPSSARPQQTSCSKGSSPDLVTWTEEPDGPAPRPGEVDQGGCWSGVGLLDRASDPAGVPTLVYSAVDGRADHLAPVVVSRLTDDLTGFTQRGRVVAEAPEDVEL